MPLAALSLLSPMGLLACLLALVPVAVLGRAARQQRRVAQAIGLEPTTSRTWLAPAALSAGACLALGVAAAQPVLTTTSAQSARTASEVVFVVDVSQSMLGAAGPGESTRLEQARDAVSALRASVPDVPAGLSGLTDRVLPYAFPTLAAGVFAETLSRSVDVNTPPPQQVSTVATSYAPLATLVEDGFFSRGTDDRTCVLVTDGETRTEVGEVSALSGERGCRLLVVRVGGSNDRIYRRDGSVVAGYRPEASAPSTVAELARLAGGTAYGTEQLADATDALKRAANVGPTEEAAVSRSAHALAPWLVVLALVLASVLVVRALHRPANGLQRLRRRRYDAATGF